MVAQSIMVVKDVAAEVAEEQLKEQAFGEGRSTAKKGAISQYEWWVITLQNAFLFLVSQIFLWAECIYQFTDYSRFLEDQHYLIEALKSNFWVFISKFLTCW